MSQSIWYLLADAKGDPLPGTNTDKVKPSKDWDVADLKNAVWEKNKEADLKGVSPARLMVYQNKEAMTALEVDDPVEGLGLKKAEAVIIIVPQTQSKLLFYFQILQFEYSLIG